MDWIERANAAMAAQSASLAEGRHGGGGQAEASKDAGEAAAAVNRAKVASRASRRRGGGGSLGDI